MISKRCLTNLTNYLFLVPLFIKFKFEEIFAKHEIKIWVEFSQFRENQNLGNIFAKKKKKKLLKYDNKLYIFGTIVHQIKIRENFFAKHEIKIWAKFSHFPEIRIQNEMIF